MYMYTYCNSLHSDVMSAVIFCTVTAIAELVSGHSPFPVIRGGHLSRTFSSKTKGPFGQKPPINFCTHIEDILTKQNMFAEGTYRGRMSGGECPTSLWAHVTAYYVHASVPMLSAHCLQPIQVYWRYLSARDTGVSGLAEAKQLTKPGPPRSALHARNIIRYLATTDTLSHPRFCFICLREIL